MATNGMTIAAIQSNLLKYIPKKVQKYLTWLDKWGNSYLVSFDISEFEPDATEDYQVFCDSVAELRWTASQFAKTYKI